MKLESLITKLEYKEGLEIEFKAAVGGIPANPWETISAFANTNGGWILLGVADMKPGLVVQGLKNADAMKQDLTNLMRNPQKINTEVCGAEDIRIESMEDKNIIVVRVRAASSKQKPIFTGENPYKGTFVRRNEGDYRCKREEVNRMIRDAGADGADSGILKGYAWGDIKTDTLDQYRQRFRQFNPANPNNAYDDMRFLKAIGGYRVDRESG